MESRSKVLVPTACNKKMGKIPKVHFPDTEEKHGVQMFHRPRFPDLWFVRMWPIVNEWTFQMHLLCICREKVKPGSRAHSKRGQIHSECCECQKPCEPLLGFHLAGMCPIETITPEISWDLRSCSFSYWVG